MALSLESVAVRGSATLAVAAGCDGDATNVAQRGLARRNIHLAPAPAVMAANRSSAKRPSCRRARIARSGCCWSLTSLRTQLPAAAVGRWTSSLLPHWPTQQQSSKKDCWASLLPSSSRWLCDHCSKPKKRKNLLLATIGVLLLLDGCRWINCTNETKSEATTTGDDDRSTSCWRRECGCDDSS